MPYSQSVHLQFNRRSFIGGSDARVIMGNDEPALTRLWKNAANSVPRIYQATSSCGSEKPPRI